MKRKRVSILIFDRGDHPPVICLVKHLRSIRNNLIDYKKRMDRLKSYHAQWDVLKEVAQKDIDYGQLLCTQYESTINTLFKNRNQTKDK